MEDLSKVSVVLPSLDPNSNFAISLLTADRLIPSFPVLLRFSICGI